MYSINNDIFQKTFSNFCINQDQLLYFSINPEKNIWFSENWFMETDNTATDMSTSIKVDRILYRSRSNYQDILIFYK